MKKLMICMLCFTTMAFFTMGCGGTGTAEAATTTTSTLGAQFFSARDMEVGYDSENCTTISLSENEIIASDESVAINGSTVTIVDEGSYLVSGSLGNGQIVVDAIKTAKIQIILDNVSLSAKNTAPIYVKQGDKVFITMAQDSKNSLSVTGEFINIDENNIDAVIYSKEDLSLNGNGTLSIATEYGNGITSKDNLILTSGTYEINASGHGLEGKDQLGIAQGTYQITAGKDGLHSENTDDTTLGQIYIADGAFEISAQGDGIDASAFVEIDDGTFDIVTGGGSENAPVKQSENDFPTMRARPNGGGAMTPPDGTPTDSTTMTPPDAATTKTPTEMASETVVDTADGEAATTTISTKGIKATGNVNLNGGTFALDTYDDAIHGNLDVSIKGGTFDILTGDDGIHAENNVLITEGTIRIPKCYEGIEGTVVTVSGGDITIVATDDGINATKATVATGTTNIASEATTPSETKMTTPETTASETGTAADTPMRGMSRGEEGVCIEITGGNLHISSGGDGIDSNGDVLVSGGTTYVFGPSSGADNALDYDGEGTITGGTFVAVGTTSMLQNFGTSSTQGTMLVNLETAQTGEIALADASGVVLAKCVPEKSYQGVLMSTPEIKTEQTYTLVAGEETQKIEMTTLIYGEGGRMGGGKGQFTGTGEGGERPQRPEGEMKENPERTIQSAPENPTS